MTKKYLDMMTSSARSSYLFQAKIQKDKSVHPISRKEHMIGPVPNELIHVAGTQYQVVKQRTFVEIELKRYL